MEVFMKLLFVSLGCDKNLVDSEYMLGMLEKAGIEITDDENDADIIVVNTCCFINDAKEESVNTILEMAQLKTEGKCKALLVTGCLAERYREEIETEIPEVDAILGTNSYDAIVNAVNEALKNTSVLPHSKDCRRRMPDVSLQPAGITRILRSRKDATSIVRIVSSRLSVEITAVYRWKIWLRRQKSLRLRV